MQTKAVHWGLFCNSENLETSANEFLKFLNYGTLIQIRQQKRVAKTKKKKKKVEMWALL